MHFISPDLYLKRLSRMAQQGGMQRLVHVELGHGNVVLEPAGDWSIDLMDRAQGRVAVLDRLHFHTYRKKIVDLIYPFILHQHFLVNAEVVLDPSVDLAFDACVLHARAHFTDHLIDMQFPGLHPVIYILNDHIESIGFQIHQSQVIKFGFQFGHTQALGDGGIDLHGLPGFFDLLLPLHVLKCPHIMQPVCQLDDDHPQVLGHGQEHLPQVLGLHLHLVRHVPDLCQLGNPVHQLRYLFAKLVFKLLQRDVRILHHIMKDPGADGVAIHVHVDQYQSYLERVNDIRFSGFSPLLLVGRAGQKICLPLQTTTSVFII